MSTTYTNEALIKRLKTEHLPHREAIALSKEPYSEEVFLVGIETGNFFLAYIPAESQTERIQLLSVEKRPWWYQHVSNPTYTVSLKAVELDPSNLAKVPKDQRTEELVEMAIEASLNIRRSKKRQAVCSWGSIPKPLRTSERLNRFIEIDGRVVKFLKDSSCSKEQLQSAIQSKPQSIKEMDLDTLDEELIILAMSLDGELLEYIPPHRQTPAVINAAIIQNGSVVRLLDQLTDEQILLLIEHHPHCIRLTHQPIPLQLVKQAILRSPGAFDPKKFLAHRTLMPITLLELIRQRNIVYPGYYNHFRDTEDLELLKELDTILAKDLGQLESTSSFSDCLLALSSPCEGSDFYLRSLQEMVDYNHRSREEVTWLTHTFLNNLDYPNKIRRDDFNAKEKQKLLKEDGLNLRNFSLEKQTEKMARLATRQNPEALKYVRPNFKSYRLCRSLVQTNPTVAIYSPYHVEDAAHEQLKQTKLNPFY